jgi:hypothetical protein
LVFSGKNVVKGTMDTSFIVLVQKIRYKNMIPVLGNKFKEFLLYRAMPRISEGFHFLQ